MGAYRLEESRWGSSGSLADLSELLWPFLSLGTAVLWSPDPPFLSSLLPSWPSEEPPAGSASSTTAGPGGLIGAAVSNLYNTPDEEAATGQACMAWSRTGTLVVVGMRTKPVNR